VQSYCEAIGHENNLFEDCAKEADGKRREQRLQYLTACSKARLDALNVQKAAIQATAAASLQALAAARVAQDPSGKQVDAVAYIGCIGVHRKNSEDLAAVNDQLETVQVFNAQLAKVDPRKVAEIANLSREFRIVDARSRRLRQDGLTLNNALIAVDCDKIAELAAAPAGKITEEVSHDIWFKGPDGTLYLKSGSSLASLPAVQVNLKKTAAAERLLANLTHQAVVEAKNGASKLKIETYVGGAGAKDLEVAANYNKADGTIEIKRLTADGNEMVSATLSKKQVDSCELYTEITPADLFKYAMCKTTNDGDRVVAVDGYSAVAITKDDAAVNFSVADVADALIPSLQSNQEVFDAIKAANGTDLWVEDTANQYLDFHDHKFSKTLENVNINGIVVPKLVIEKLDAAMVTINGLGYQNDDLVHLLDANYKPKNIGIGGSQKSAPKASHATLQTWANVELGSAVLRSVAALTEQQLQRIYGDDSKMALISGIVLDALRVTNDLLATNNERMSGRIGVVDVVALAWVGADLFDIYEKAMQLKNGKKSDVASEDVAEDVKDASEEAKVSAKSVNKLAALFKQAAPALESICVMVCGIAKYENADADLLRLAYYSRLALSAIRSVNMILTTDAKSIKRKAAYTIGALTVIGFIVDLIVKKSGGAGKGGKGAGANGTEVIIKAGDTKLPVEILNMVA
jgi:hypothetical protein